MLLKRIWIWPLWDMVFFMCQLISFGLMCHLEPVVTDFLSGWSVLRCKWVRKPPPVMELLSVWPLCQRIFPLRS